MNEEAITSALGQEIDKADADYHKRRFGEYHPSMLSGCELGAFLDFMTEKQIPLNNYMFSGTAVHYYLQESGILESALHEAGYHALDTVFEVSNRIEVAPDVWIVGRADVLCHNGDHQAVIDLKYTSLKSHYDSGRLYKYATQVNTYAAMFSADMWGLLLIYSKADSIPDEIDMMTNEFKEESWSTVQDKAVRIHRALEHYGYPDGERWTVEQLKRQGRDFWEDVMEFFNEDLVPFYDGELKYSDRDEWVMPYQDGWREEDSSGLGSFKGGV